LSFIKQIQAIFLSSVVKAIVASWEMSFLEEAGTSGKNRELHGRSAVILLPLQRLEN
jgi:hypothetical protein